MKSNTTYPHQHEKDMRNTSWHSKPRHLTIDEVLSTNTPGNLNLKISLACRQNFYFHCDSLRVDLVLKLSHKGLTMEYCSPYILTADRSTTMVFLRIGVSWRRMVWSASQGLFADHKRTGKYVKPLFSTPFSIRKFMLSVPLWSHVLRRQEWWVQEAKQSFPNGWSSHKLLLKP